MTKDECKAILQAYAGSESQEYITAVEDYGDDTPEYWQQFTTPEQLIEDYNLFELGMIGNDTPTESINRLKRRK